MKECPYVSKLEAKFPVLESAKIVIKKGKNKRHEIMADLIPHLINL